MTEKNQIPRKHVFELHQHAAFALASNQAVEINFKSIVESQHFYNLVNKGGINFDKDLVLNFLKNIRNYSSHYHHNDLAPLSEDLSEFFGLMEKRARQLFYVRHQNGKTENKQIVSWLTNNDQPLFTLSNGTNINDLPQIEIAFLLSPFLTRHQLSMLWGKINHGQDAYEKDENGKFKKDQNGKSVLTERIKAIKALLNLIAAPDSIIIRARDDEDSWLHPSHEQGFAIYENLCLYIDDGDCNKQSIPEKYLMRQLLIFIRHHQILPGYSFAQIKTEVTEDAAQSGADLLEQKTIYGNDAKYPYNIRYNTITAKNDQADVIGTFSLELLMAIVAVYLKNNKPQDIADFISDWLKNHSDYSHRTLKKRTDQSIQGIVSARCDFLIQKQNKTENRLFDQIRFICQRINQAWLIHYGYFMGKNQYQELENKVRYYNKEDLRQFLTNTIWTKDGVGLGRGNDKSLGKCIKKDRLQDVFNDLSKAWCDYLKGVQEGLHKIQSDKLYEMAKSLGCRLPSSAQNTPNMPVGLPPKVFKNHFGIQKDFNFYRSIHTFATLEQPKESLGKKGERKSPPYGQSVASIIRIDNIARREWCRKQLLLAMATKNIMKIIDDQRNEGMKKDIEALKPLSEYPIQIKTEQTDTGYKFIEMTLGKSWRMYAKYGNKILKGLIKHYLDDQKLVPLLRADEKSEGQSIESALMQCDRERLILIQAALKFEQLWITQNRQKFEQIEKGQGGEIKFSSLCQAESQNTDLATFRDCALHGKILCFSKCPEPLQEIYKSIESNQVQRRSNIKKKHINSR